jgi:hypothetical protein
MTVLWKQDRTKIILQCKQNNIKPPATIEHFPQQVPNPVCNFISQYSLEDADDQAYSLNCNIILFVQCHGYNAVLEFTGEKLQLAFQLFTCVQWL